MSGSKQLSNPLPESVAATNDDPLTIPPVDCAMTDTSNIRFTLEELERYAKWKAEWLKERGMTEAEYQADLDKFLSRIRFGS